jgi:hypothetical protein
MTTDDVLAVALGKLREARTAARQFMAVSPGWTAKVPVDELFDQVEDRLRDFNRTTYGSPTPPRTTP